MATILDIQTINEVFIYEVDGDPSAGAGTPAPRGRLLFTALAVRCRSRGSPQILDGSQSALPYF